MPELVRIWEDAACELHRMVVGPMDNNVYVLRCRRTGEALLVDAANEHEALLEVCQRLGVHQVVETHGHWDHIQAVAAVREAGISVSVTAEDAAMLPSYDLLLEDDSVLEVGKLRVRTVATPGHTPGSMCFAVEGTPLLLTGRHPVPRADPATPSSRAATSRRSSARSRAGCSPATAPTRSSCPATVPRPPSGPSPPASRSGSTAAGEPA